MASRVRTGGVRSVLSLYTAEASVLLGNVRLARAHAALHDEQAGTRDQAGAAFHQRQVGVSR